MIEERKEIKMMMYFTIFYLLVFSIMSILNKNYEFLYYTIIMSAIIILILKYNKQLHLSVAVIFGLTLVGAMHVLGGNIVLGGTRLYDSWLIPGILRYDHLVHFFAIAVSTIVAYSLLYPHLDKKLKCRSLMLSILLILIASGIGAFNEIIELFAVVFLGAAEQVGDYFNNALDLVFNLLGAVLASIYIIIYHKRR